MRSPFTNLSISLRLALYSQEVVRLPAGCHGVSVRQGLAWLTVHGQDRILKAGDRTMFEPGRFPAVVTALGQTPLVLEVLGSPSRPAASSARTTAAAARHEAVL